MRHLLVAFLRSDRVIQFKDGAADMTTNVTAGPYEQLIGRLMALCRHPVAAWQLTAGKERSLLVLAYFSAGYFGAICTLLLWSR